jgi:pimeloyl-ACP methyl ester carboxylesterase
VADGQNRAVTERRPVTLWTADGIRLFAQHWQTGDAPGGIAVVVAHGFTGSSRNPHVVRICEALAAHGFDLLAVDFRGHGRSGGRSTAGGDEIHDVAAAVAWLRDRGYPTVAIAGWSMGGTSVLRHAGLGGDADAVVSVSAPGTWFERGTRAMRIVHWMFEKRLGRMTALAVRRTRIAARAWDEDLPEQPADVVGAISPRPLLIVHGEADHYFPLTHVEAIAAAAPSAEVWIEPMMGHAETATTAELLDRIARWIASSVDASTAGSAVAVCDDDRRD